MLSNSERCPVAVIPIGTSVYVGVVDVVAVITNLPRSEAAAELAAVIV
jgi:hypothetical protein